MKLNFGTLIRNRRLARALRSIHPQILDLEQRFEAHYFIEPIHDALLVSLIEEIDEPRIVENKDNVFQIMIPFGGIPEEIMSDPIALIRAVADRLDCAIQTCPFSAADTEPIYAVFREWKESLEK